MNSQPSILIVTAELWLGITRMPGALKRAGFQVAAFTVQGGPLSKSSAIDRLEMYPAGTTLPQWQERLLAFVMEVSPALIVAGDETAAQSMQWMIGHPLGYLNVARKSDDPEWHKLLAHLLLATGPSEHYAALLLKPHLMDLAASLGLPVPERRIVESLEDVMRFSREFPNFVLKSERGFGGAGVRICSPQTNLAQAYPELIAATRTSGSTCVEVQRFVEGPSGETVFVAWKGRVLDAFVIVRECRSPPGTGQSTRIRLIENAEALEQTRKIVEATSFSGFGGIEFVLERANGANDRSSDLTGDEHPVVIEFNPRPLPFTHLGPVFGHDLATALYAQIQSTPYSPSNSPITQSVTLFPQEFLRDPNSPYLYTSYHDVPWDDPQLLSWMLRA